MKLAEMSVGKRIGVTLVVTAVLLLGMCGWVALRLSELNAGWAASMVLAVGVIACVVLFGLSVMIMKWLRREIGCEPGYASWIANKIAMGNLQLKIDTKPDDRSSLLYAIVTMRDSLARIVRQARAGAEAVASASSELANNSQNISSRTGQQVDSLTTTAAAMEQMTATVQQNAVHVGEASSLANTASKAAHRGGEVVSQVVETMTTINNSSKKIVDIIGVIDGIAFQTNILALNAAVEASHAGDQGRGFAVVAAEVRALAQRTAEAAREVKVLIQDSASKIETGSGLVGQAGTAMQEIVSGVAQVTDVISHIKLATDQQSQGLMDISMAVAQLDQLAQQNAQLVNQAAAAAETMQDQAGTLAQSVSVFKLVGSMLDTGGDGAAKARAPQAPAVPGKRARGYQSRLIRFGYGLEAESNQGRATRFFAKELAERTGGKLKVKESGNASLGNDDEMQEALITGSLQMMVGSTSTLVKYVKDFGVFDLPFLFSSEQEAALVLDGRVGQGLAAKLSDLGLVGLVYWENGFRNLTNSKRPIAKLEDLQGIRLRVMQNPAYIELFNSFGANAVPLPFSELFLALETKQVDGQENPLNTIQSSRFYEVQKYLSLTKHVYSPWIMTASKPWWDTLSDEERNAIRGAADAARDFERRDSRESASKALDFLRKQGMQVTELSDKELERMRAKARALPQNKAYEAQLTAIRGELGPRR